MNETPHGRLGGRHAAIACGLAAAAFAGATALAAIVDRGTEPAPRVVLVAPPAPAAAQTSQAVARTQAGAETPLPPARGGLAWQHAGPERGRVALPVPAKDNDLSRAISLRRETRRAAERYGVSEPLFLALVEAESAFQHDAVSRAGAVGPAQLIPSTADLLGVDEHDWRENLDGGARYLHRQLKAFETPNLALAAYNAGPGAVSRFGGVPPYDETRSYVARVLDRATQIRDAEPSELPQIVQDPGARGRLARLALDLVGTPYSWGGGTLDGPSEGVGRGEHTVGLDCSSYLRLLYRQAWGVTIPRVTYDQIDAGVRVPLDAIRAGDAVFFGPTEDAAHHVGLYLGDGLMVHAPQTGDVVRVTPLSERDDLVAARRYAEPLAQ